MSETKKSDAKTTAKTEVPPPNPTTVQPANKRLVDWIIQLGSNDVRVDRIDMGVASRDCNHITRPITFEIISPGCDIDDRDAVLLANRLVAAANDDATSARKAQTYLVVATARTVSSTPISTILIAGEPTTQLVMSRGVGSAEFVEADGAEDGGPIDTMQRRLVSYSKHLTESVQIERDMYSTGMLELSTGWNALVRSQFEANKLLSAQLTEAMNQNRQLFSEYTTASREREAALSMASERETAREWQKIKAEMLRDGFKVGQRSLQMWFGRMLADGGGKPAEPQMAGEMSVEREGVVEWLADCGRAGVDKALFGEWAEGPPPRLTKRGVFSPDQFLVLARVAKGLASPDTLIALLPDSGSPYAVAPEQLQAIQTVPGVSQGLLMSAVALFDLVGQRRDKLGEEGVRRVLASMQPAAAAAPATSAPPVTPPRQAPASDQHDAV